MEEQIVDNNNVISLSSAPILYSTIFANALTVILFSFVRKRNKEKDKSYLLLRPCPNPNCIRCQLYKKAQDSAKRRLPYVIKSCNCEFDSLKRVIDGVRFPPAVDGSTIQVRGQYPSVLFVPRLPVYPIATSLHQKVISEVFKPSSSSCQVLVENLLEEYCNSQIINDKGWQTNNAGATDPANPNQLWLSSKSGMKHNEDLYSFPKKFNQRWSD